MNAILPDQAASFVANFSADTPAPPVDPLTDLTFDWTEAGITPRRWIAPGRLLRGAVTVIVGPGAGGKSLLLVGWTVALALGRPLHRMEPVAPSRVLLFNIEDDLDEQRRRFSAALRPIGGLPPDLEANVAVVSTHTIGTLLTRDRDTGRVTFTATMCALEDRIARFRPDVVILDPLVELHDTDENGNVEMRSIVATFRAMARRHDCAIVLVHHVRKGAAKGAGDPDVGRGASAINAAARVVLTLVPMTEDEGRALGVRPGQHRFHFRVDGAKENYSRPSQAEWFAIESIVLDNAESVPIALPWVPPVDAVTDEVRSEIMAAIALGTLNGPWSPKLSRDDRSVAGLLARHGIATATGQARTLADLFSAGVVSAPYRRATRSVGQGLRTPDGRPAAAWITDEVEGTQ